MVTLSDFLIFLSARHISDVTLLILVKCTGMTPASIVIIFLSLYTEDDGVPFEENTGKSIMSVNLPEIPGEKKIAIIN